MPRRRVPNPVAQAVGGRIRQLREELALTMEKLAFESDIGSKGHLSNLERGLAVPTVQTLQAIADRLGVDLLDLVTFPDHDDRQRLVDLTRRMTPGTIRRLLRESVSPPSGASAKLTRAGSGDALPSTGRTRAASTSRPASRRKA